MGKFDKKVNKKEPDAPKSQIEKKRKSNEHMFKLDSNRSLEKERNMKVFNLMQRKKDQGKGPLDETKLAKVSKKKHDKAHKYAS